MATKEIDVQIGNGLGDDLELTMRGKPEAIVNVLVHGLERDSLQRIADELAAELARRAEDAKERGADSASTELVLKTNPIPPFELPSNRYCPACNRRTRVEMESEPPMWAAKGAGWGFVTSIT